MICSSPQLKRTTAATSVAVAARKSQQNNFLPNPPQPPRLISIVLFCCVCKGQRQPPIHCFVFLLFYWPDNPQASSRVVLFCFVLLCLLFEGGWYLRRIDHRQPPSACRNVLGTGTAVSLSCVNAAAPPDGAGGGRDSGMSLSRAHSSVSLCRANSAGIAAADRRPNTGERQWSVPSIFPLSGSGEFTGGAQSLEEIPAESQVNADSPVLEILTFESHGIKTKNPRGSSMVCGRPPLKAHDSYISKSCRKIYCPLIKY